MGLVEWVMLVYALLLIVGGLMGFRAGSKVSLMAGGGSGVAMLLALYVAQSNPRAGVLAAGAISLVLSAIFGRRLAASGKFMPSGMLLLVSLVSLVVFGWSIATTW
jgi:uncharacterized membrane protein (UPF0136 family)